MKHLVGTLLLFGLPLASLRGESTPRWIWNDVDHPRTKDATFRRSFTIDKPVRYVKLTALSDYCHCRVTLDGKPIGLVEAFADPLQRELGIELAEGEHTLTMSANGYGGPSAVALRLEIVFDDKTTRSIDTDRRWQTRATPEEKWRPAHELGEVRDLWPRPSTIDITTIDDYTQWKRALGTDSSADPSRFFVHPDFRIELLRSAKKDEGSWVSLEFDPKGRLIVAREDKGLLRFTLPKDGKGEIRVETINDTLKECRGLLYAHGSLYANANESKGLYRLTDTTGDDKFDSVKLLLRTDGSVGHGRNDLALGPDGRIYAIQGDAVEMPGSARNLCSPLQKTNRKGRHGFVLRMDPDGKNAEIVASGLRNPYGIDFDTNGEMFTYDADAEYDMGAPWYRPTRVHHLLPGGDYGWRAVTRSWPPYDPNVADAAPPGLDIGKGSPTAVKFGTKSKFSTKYRRALFVLDWAYGRILAVHTTPRGASYSMRAETFVQGQPFNATDLGFGPDGAMYIITGGRKTQSGLYRIRYVGTPKPEPEPTIQQRARTEYAEGQRRLRGGMEETFAKPEPGFLAFAWAMLDTRDPALRHAARISIEKVALERWRERPALENQPHIALPALLALARGAHPKDLENILGRLAKFAKLKLTQRQLATMLRIHEIILDHENGKRDDVRSACLAQLDPLYPASSFALEERLSLLLAKLDAPKFVPRSLALLERAPTPDEQLHYLFVLRHKRKEWTPERHRVYFSWLARLRGTLGGDGMPTFLAKIEAEALARLTPEEKKLVEPLLAKSSITLRLSDPKKTRKFVRAWKFADFEETLSLNKRNFERGQSLFRQAACSGCHRVGSVGAAIGPDLTSVGQRFSPRDIMRSIVESDAVVAEQYRRTLLETKNGKIVQGMLLSGSDYRSPTLSMLPNPLAPEKVVTIAKKDIERHIRLSTSTMPNGLLDTLTKDEILDLVAYLRAGGNRNHPSYRE